MNSLKLEGAKYGIQVNAVVPSVSGLQKQAKPGYAAALVLYHCSEQCQESGGIYQAGTALYATIGSDW